MRYAAAVFAALLLTPAIAAAQSEAFERPGFILTAVDELPVPTPQQPRLFLPPPPQRFEAQRPKALMPLYVSFAALQGLDMYTTRRALDRGAQEANPLMRGAVGRDATMIAMKAGGSAVAIWATERLWKKKRGKMAIASAVVLNVVSGLVVMNNFRIVQ